MKIRWVLKITVVLAALVAAAVHFENSCQRCVMQRCRQLSQTHNDIMILSTAVSLYQLDSGAYPASIDDLVTNRSGATNWLGPYVTNASPRIDPWGSPYRIGPRPGQGPTVFVWSAGPDRKESADDMIEPVR